MRLDRWTSSFLSLTVIEVHKSEIGTEVQVSGPSVSTLTLFVWLEKETNSEWVSIKWPDEVSDVQGWQKNVDNSQKLPFNQIF